MSVNALRPIIDNVSQEVDERMPPVDDSKTKHVIMRPCPQSDLSSLCLSGPSKLLLVPLVPRALPGMSNSSSHSTKMLGQRLARLQDPLLGFTTEELRNLDFDALGKLKVSFGKTKKGMSFLQAVESDPGWTKWCTDHLVGTGKAEHEAFLIFVDKYVEQGRRRKRAAERWDCHQSEKQAPGPQEECARHRESARPVNLGAHARGRSLGNDGVPGAIQQRRLASASQRSPRLHGAHGACTPAGPGEQCSMLASKTP